MFRYRESVSRISRLFRAKPMHPAEVAVFWVEHVLEHGGDHLRPSSVHLSLPQLLLLDVILAVAGAILLPVLLLRALCCRGKNQHGHERSSKKTN